VKRHLLILSAFGIGILFTALTAAREKRNDAEREQAALSNLPVRTRCGTIA
jgi:hypothetical protein